MTTPATPRTSAGRDALEILADPNSDVEHRHLILAIEREAAPAHNALLAALRALVEADHRTQPDPLGQTVPHDRLIALWDAEHKARALLRDLSPKEEGQ